MAARATRGGVESFEKDGIRRGVPQRARQRPTAGRATEVSDSRESARQNSSTPEWAEVGRNATNPRCGPGEGVLVRSSRLGARHLARACPVLFAAAHQPISAPIGFRGDCIVAFRGDFVTRELPRPEVPSAETASLRKPRPSAYLGAHRFPRRLHRRFPRGFRHSRDRGDPLLGSFLTQKFLHSESSFIKSRRGEERWAPIARRKVDLGHPSPLALPGWQGGSLAKLVVNSVQLSRRTSPGLLRRTVRKWDCQSRWWAVEGRNGTPDNSHKIW